MAIQMHPMQFPEDHRRDPNRTAQASVFDALQSLNLYGYGLYESRDSSDGMPLDFALWLARRGRIALVVKGGRYRLDQDGQWRLLNEEGQWAPVSSPLEEAEDACLELHQAISNATGFYCFVGSALVLPDMEPDERMERAALEREHVGIIWGLENLDLDLQRTVEQVGFQRINPHHALNEWSQVALLQSGTLPETDRSGPGGGPHSPGDISTATPFRVRFATFNIRHVENLLVQQLPGEDGDDGGPDQPPRE